MNRLHVFAEGFTEQDFLRRLIFPRLDPANISPTTCLLTTNRGKNAKGGVVSYAKIKKQIMYKCRESSKLYVTTMFDLFRLPTDFPQYNQSHTVTDPHKKAIFLENAMNEDIGYRNFFANIVVHEFEALLFSDPEQFIHCESFDQKMVTIFCEIRKKFSSPEHINGGAETAPSKRIINICPAYKKRVDGLLIAWRITLDKILKECSHFRAWFEKISQLEEISATV